MGSSNGQARGLLIDAKGSQYSKFDAWSGVKAHRCTARQQGELMVPQKRQTATHVHSTWRMEKQNHSR